MTRITLLGLSLLVASGLACKNQNVLSVDKVEPNEGITAGGDQVTIHGGGFEPGKTQVEIRFGRQRADQVTIASNSTITVTTPPGDRGPVDVTLMFDNGAPFKIAEGFRYVPSTGGSDVRKAFFSDKPGTAKPATTPTSTTPPPAPK